MSQTQTNKSYNNHNQKRNEQGSNRLNDVSNNKNNNGFSMYQYLVAASKTTTTNTSNVDGVGVQQKEKKQQLNTIAVTSSKDNTIKKKNDVVQLVGTSSTSTKIQQDSPTTVSSSLTPKIKPTTNSKTLKKRPFFVKEGDVKEKKPTKLKRNIMIYKNAKEKVTQIELEKEQVIEQPLQQVNENINNVQIEIIETTTTTTTTQLSIDDPNNVNNINDDKIEEKLNNLNIDDKEDEIEFKQDYINQLVNDEIDQVAREFIIRIKSLQDNYVKINPNKPPKKRYLTGLKEIERGVDSGKIKCVVFAPNIEDVNCEGGLNPLIRSTIRLCRRNQVLYTFALSRRIIGKLLHVPIKISVFGIIDYDGAHELYKKLEMLTTRSRTQFKQSLKQESIQRQLQEHQQDLKQVDQLANKEIKDIKKKHNQILKQQSEAKLEKDKLQADKLNRIKEFKKQRILQQQQQEHQLKLNQKKLINQSSTPNQIDKDKDKDGKEIPPKSQQQQSSSTNKSSSNKVDKMIHKDDASTQLLYDNTIEGSSSKQHQLPSSSTKPINNNNNQKKKK